MVTSFPEMALMYAHLDAQRTHMQDTLQQLDAYVTSGDYDRESLLATGDELGATQDLFITLVLGDSAPMTPERSSFAFRLGAFQLLAKHSATFKRPEALLKFLTAAWIDYNVRDYGEYLTAFRRENMWTAPVSIFYLLTLATIDDAQWRDIVRLVRRTYLARSDPFYARRVVARLDTVLQYARHVMTVDDAQTLGAWYDAAAIYPYPKRGVADHSANARADIELMTNDDERTLAASVLKPALIALCTREITNIILGLVATSIPSCELLHVVTEALPCAGRDVALSDVQGIIFRVRDSLAVKKRAEETEAAVAPKQARSNE